MDLQKCLLFKHVFEPRTAPVLMLEKNTTYFKSAKFDLHLFTLRTSSSETFPSIKLKFLMAQICKSYCRKKNI